jgi:hypothetical protein
VRRFRIHILLAACSGALLIASLRIPREVQTHGDLAAVPLGFPFSFAQQNQSVLDPPSFPRQQCLQSPWDYPLRIHCGRMALSFGCILTALELAVAGIRRVARMWRGHSHPP